MFQKLTFLIFLAKRSGENSCLALFRRRQWRFLGCGLFCFIFFALIFDGAPFDGDAVFKAHGVDHAFGGAVEIAFDPDLLQPAQKAV